MARLSQLTPTSPSSSPEKGAAELNQLLSRLEQTILRADQDRERRLRSSEFERARLNRNLEYARSLLTRLERDALAVKVQSRRQEMQVELNQRRELLEQLIDRMNDLGQLHADDDDNSSDGEDILGEIIPTPSESMDSRSTDIHTEDTDEAEEEEPEIPDLPPPVQAHPPPGQSQTTTTSELRSRTNQPTAIDTADTTSASTSRSALFASRRKAPPTTQSSTATAEAILDQQRVEQDALSESILKMAGALKTSSQRFSSTLDEDKSVVDRAGDGMEKTERGMDAASRRMGTLRRMTEGKGWWGRMMLFAWVYGMMVALVLLVFVLPKLRF